MRLKKFGTDYGGWTIDIDLVPETGVVLDCGVGTDMSFAEGLHRERPLLKFIMVDHTDEAEHFVKKTRGYSWAEFVKAAIAPKGVKTLMMCKHKTRSGSESFSDGHRFADPAARYEVPAVSLADLIAKWNPCIVKLDIESAEYATIREAIGVPQVCFEAHHRMDSNFTKGDTDSIVADFRRSGYEVLDWTPTDEILMVKK